MCTGPVCQALGLCAIMEPSFGRNQSGSSYSVDYSIGVQFLVWVVVLGLVGGSGSLRVQPGGWFLVLLGVRVLCGSNQLR